MIRAAVSTLSCFNHRVSVIEANVKFRTVPGSDDDVFDEVAFASHLPGSLARVPGEKAKRGVGRDVDRDALARLGVRKTETKKKKTITLRHRRLRRGCGSHQEPGRGPRVLLARVVRVLGGLHPDAKGMKKYRPVMTTPRHTPGLLAVEPSQAWDPITLGGVGVCENAEDLGVFYEELHAYLARSGGTA